MRIDLYGFISRPSLVLGSQVVPSLIRSCVGGESSVTAFAG